MRGLDAWITREQPDPVTDPHAPWMAVFVTVEGDHDPDDRSGIPGSWAVEHGGDTDAETTFVVGTREQAEESARRCNARYFDHVPSSNGTWCTVCGDYLGEVDFD